MVNVKLRPLETNDLDNMMTWINDPSVVGNFANFKFPISREEESKYLESIVKSDTDKMFAIETESGEYLGNTGINQIHWPTRSGRFSIIIGNKNHWGEGYGQAALNELLKLSFEQYNLHKVWLIVREKNEKNRHIMEKLGFTKEGVLRDEYFLKGKYENMVRYSMLENEYFARRK